MSAISNLKEDHAVIKRVLGTLKDALASDELPLEMLLDTVTFSQTLVDRCHHSKEEDCLFPCLENRGMPKEGGPIGIMLMEHEMGRKLVGAIEDALTRYQAGESTKEEVVKLCDEYIDLLEQHICKEDNILFNMGSQIMLPADDEKTVECYEKTELEKVGEETHREMLELVKKIEGMNK